MRRSAPHRNSCPSNPIELLYVSAPEPLAEGVFDASGSEVDARSTAARLVISLLPGPVWQLWAIFASGLGPGQHGYLTFNNIHGEQAVAGAFTEWDVKKHTPFFSDSLMILNSVQRAPGRVRIIGRNDSKRRVVAAAGFLFIAPS